MNRYMKELLQVLEFAIENDAVSYDLYYFLQVRHFNLNHKNSIDDINLYRAFIKAQISQNKYGYTHFINEAQSVNNAIYKDYITLYCKTLRERKNGAEKTGCVCVEYSKLRNRLVSKYADIKPPEPTDRLSTKDAQEYAKISKWKNSAIDDMAELMVIMQQYNIEFN